VHVRRSKNLICGAMTAARSPTPQEPTLQHHEVAYGMQVGSAFGCLGHNSLGDWLITTKVIYIVVYRLWSL